MIKWEWGWKSVGDPQQAFNCRAKDETGGLGLEEQKERCGSAISLFVTLAGVAIGLAGRVC